MKIFGVFLLILVPLFCQAGEYEEYMDETFSLINMGEYEEALERFIWFHNNAVEQGMTTDPSRLSFGLMYWMDFGKKYPPALDALKRIRNDNTNLILNGEKTCDLFNEVESINKHLSEEYKTIELFRRIDKEQPLLAKKCWIYFKELAIKNNNIYFIDKYIHDLKEEYNNVERHFMRTMRFLSTDPIGNKDLVNITKDGYVNDVQELLSIAKKNNIEASKYIQDRFYSVAKKNDIHGISGNN